ncbi:juvenile hormone esterase-like isoform X2 [Thrips palmi]|uniref:Carboxylic ester hydrolase n=1 Tax=Thrips palmi TaxID=161013 RepID=A0A6P8Z1J3_THRPL|nr:juvenile hormone esterase-like isoform X2 [Thrips palmi]
MVTSTKKIVVVGALVLVILVIVLCAVFLTKGAETGSLKEAVVTTKQGKLAGEWVTAEDPQHFTYAAFRGIPYAQPPLGNLRFKGPKPFPPWEGVRPATTEGNPCFHDATTGSEDCLYLNVYTPRIPSAENNPQMAVYVFIYGGAFQRGSSSAEDWGPDFLVTQDIVVVTMNYRTGVFASLSLDTDEVPGNSGMKDQLHVLRWVKENIEGFGGDPSKVTLGGHSSGGVHASWLTLVPQTKGLIRAAIIQSGTALCGLSIPKTNIELAKLVYEQLTGTTTDDKSAMTSVFKSAGMLDLYYAGANASLIMKQAKGLGMEMAIAYAPFIEQREQGEEEKLITKDPESYIIDKDANNIPIILGETAQEWTLAFSQIDMFGNETKLNEHIANLTTYVPRSIMPGSDTQDLLKIKDFVPTVNVDEIVKKLTEFYFKNDDDKHCGTNCKMDKYLHQAAIKADTSHFLRLRSKYIQEPTYAYVFNLRTDYNIDLSALPPPFRSDVVHADELGYIWKQKQNTYRYGNDTAAIASRRLVRMLANFVKEGNPTPNIDDVINVKWQPVTHGAEETYLEITANLEKRTASMADSEIWSDIYSSFRAYKSP